MTHLLLQLFLFFAAATIAVPLAKRFGLSSVLGYLLAGIVIGPFGFSLVSDVETVMHVTEFGVVMMLFLIGLELRPTLLWQLRVPILGMGGAQVVGCTAVITLPACFFLPWQTALALGMIFSLSSTAIVLQTLREKGLAESPAGRSVFSILLFQDMAALPMFALLPLLALFPVAESHTAHGGFDLSHMAVQWKAAAIVGAVAAVWLVAKYLARPLFRIIAETEVRELFLAVVLAFVVGISLLMSLVGLSPALGVFLAGVVLADSEYRFELESDIEPFKGLLLGVFFISIGASLNFSYIWQNLGRIATLVAALVAMKWLVMQAVGRLFGTPKQGRGFPAMALAQSGEFAFVLLQFSRSNGVLESKTVNLALSVVAISMFLAPLLFLLYDRFAWSGGSEEEQHKADEITRQGARVILAGFGRVGIDVGRMLISAGVQPVIIEYDASTVETLRQFGFEVYCGDVQRLGLLESAGAAEAELLILTGSNTEQDLALIALVREHFPQLKLAAMARERGAAYDLMDAGITTLHRETFGSAMLLGGEMLSRLGFSRYEARRLTRLFQHQDEKRMPELYRAHRSKNDEEYAADYNRHNAEIYAAMLKTRGDNLVRTARAWSMRREE